MLVSPPSPESKKPMGLLSIYIIFLSSLWYNHYIGPGRSSRPEQIVLYYKYKYLSIQEAKMTDKKLKERNQIPDSYKWNIRAMYPDESKWDSDIEECMTRAEKFGCYRGRLTESASTLLE